MATEMGSPFVLIGPNGQKVTDEAAAEIVRYGNICVNWFRTLLVATLFAIAALTGPAMAHSALKSSVPSANATVAAPDALRLTFSDRVNLRFSKVTLIGAGGAAVQTAEAKVSDDGHTLIVALAARLPAGKYRVVWNALSADGHKVKGEYTFTVE